MLNKVVRIGHWEKGERADITRLVLIEHELNS